MSKEPLILKFNKLEIDFSKLEHSELLEKLFKERPVSYIATLLYIELFNITYKNLISGVNNPFFLVITYKELEERLNRKLSTLSNALAKLEEAGLIKKDRLCVANDNPDSKLSYKYILHITLRLPAPIKNKLKQKSLEILS